jgi:hypothetical protein
MSISRRGSAILIVLAAFVATPFATAQDSIDNPDESTPTTLYFHIFDTINRFVINTEPMNAEFFEVGGANFATTPGTGIEGSGVIGWNLEDGYDLNTVYGYSTAGPVEYEFIENGKPRFHPERGIAQEVIIDPSVQPMVYLYLDVRDAVGGSAQSALPDFNVRVTLQEGDDPGLDASLDEGRDILAGNVQFHIIKLDGAIDGGTACDTLCCDPSYIDCMVLNTLTEPGQAVYVPITGLNAAVEGQSGPNGKVFAVPDENGIIEIMIPMDVLQETIPKKEAYNVRLDWYQTPDPTGEVIGDDDFTQGWLRMASDPDHLPRLELSIMNPVYFSFIHPQVAGGSLLIHAGGNSPWGTYDVDLDAVDITITHESGKIVPNNQLRKLLSSNEHVHGLHDADAQLTYLWDFRDNEAELGEYTIEMTLTNDAHSAEANGKAGFIISETEAIGFDTSGTQVEATSSTGGEDLDTPSAGFVSVVGLLGAALVIARRRLNE